MSDSYYLELQLLFNSNVSNGVRKHVLEVN